MHIRSDVIFAPWSLVIASLTHRVAGTNPRFVKKHDADPKPRTLQEGSIDAPTPSQNVLTTRKLSTTRVPAPPRAIGLLNRRVPRFEAWSRTKANGACVRRLFHSSSPTRRITMLTFMPAWVPVHAPMRRGVAESRLVRWGVSRGRGDSEGQRCKLRA